MKVTAYKTPIVKAGDDLYQILRASLSPIAERSVLVVASKIVSTCESRFVPKVTGTRQEKHDLVKKEAEYYIDPRESKYDTMLTVRGNWIFANAGIDESNADDQYILWPSDPQQAVNDIWHFLREEYQLKEVGVTMSDSASMPLNWGVTGHAIAYCGFNPLRSYIGKPDLFGRPMKMEQVNVMQSVTVAATLEMGEGAEQTPLGIVEEIGDIEFLDHAPTEAELAKLHISLEDDVFAPILTSAHWNPPLNKYHAALQQVKPLVEMKANQEVLFTVAKEMKLKPEKDGDWGLLSIEHHGQRKHLFHSYTPLNSQLGSKLANNKYATRKVLATHGYDNIPFCLPATKEEVVEFFNQHQPIVAKPVNGSNSFAVFLIDSQAELDDVPYQRFYFEKYIDGAEYRYLVLAGEVVKVDRRTLSPQPGKPWKKTIESLDEELWDQALAGQAAAIAQSLDLGFCAVDFIVEPNGKVWVLEVNGSPALNRDGVSDPELAKQFLSATLKFWDEEQR